MRDHVSSVVFVLVSNLIFPCLSSKPSRAPITPLSLSSSLPRFPGRGGGSTSSIKKQKDDGLENNVFNLLADAIQPSLHKIIVSSIASHQQPTPLKAIVESFTFLSKSQSALKTIDGASHEFYQRSHSLETSTKTEVKGRAARSAGRTGCCADALFACELLDLIIDPPHQNVVDEEVISIDTDDRDVVEETTLNLAGGREILLNTTLSTTSIPLEVLVLYEAEYAGGGGINHGGIDGLLPPNSQRPRGRILIVVRDGHEADLSQTLEHLDHSPEFFDLEEGLVAQEVACVNGILWRCAEELLGILEPILRNAGNETVVVNDVKGGRILKNDKSLPAVHFVARSLAGGVVSLAAAMLNGNIPLPPVRRKRRRRQGGHRKKERQRDDQNLTLPSSSQKSERKNKYKEDCQDSDDNKKVTSKKFVQNGKDQEKSKISPALLQGFAKGRTSGVVIGAPPSLSSNVETPFITSVIHGDDIVCRVTKNSLDKLRERTIRLLEKNVLTKRVGWVADTITLAMSGIQTHAHGSEGEEARLSLAGRVYLVRPRRISGGVSSMHEIGAAGGREALRAAVLWSLNDVLLSRSLWAHHSLEAYISGLDKVQLRKFRAEEGNEGM